MLKKLLIFTFIGIFLAPLVYGATTLYPSRGGTGTFVKPSTGDLLIGQSDNTYLPFATSTLGLGDGTFTGLSDTPSSYSGQLGKFLTANSGETALEFNDIDAFEVAIALGSGSPTVDQMQEYLDNTGSSGFFIGGDLSDGGGGTLDVAAGEGFIRTTNDDNAELQSFKWAASSTIAVTDNTTQYVYVDDDGVISLSTNEFLEAPDKIQIGVANKEDGSIDHLFNLGVRLQESIAEAGRFIRRVHGISRDLRRGGLIFGQSGDANRDVTMTTGALWWGRTEYPISAFDTSGADTFETYSASGKEDATASQWPNEQFDSSGTLTTLGNNKWANLFFYLEPDDHVAMIYGRAQFVTQAQAEMEGVPSSSIPGRIAETSILASRFTFQKLANSATIVSAFDTIFTSAGVTAHNDLSTLAWTSANHTGTALTFAGFNGTGLATEYTEANYILADGTRAFTGDITILDATPILVFKDSNSLGAASVGFIEWRDSGGGRAGFLGNNSSGNDDLVWKNEQGGNIGIETTGAGDIILSLASGNVGIGTTNPLEELHISKTDNSVQIIMDTTSEAAGTAPILRIDHVRATSTQSGDLLGTITWRGKDTALSSGGSISATADAEWGTASDSTDNPTRLEFSTAPDGGTLLTRMTIDSTGFVGIGVTTPTGGLEIQGLDTSATSEGQLVLDATSNQVPQLLLKDGTKDIAVPDGQIMQFGEWSNPTFVTNMVIDANGDLGIGDPTPDARLEILSTTEPQFIITHTDGVDDAKFNVNSGGDFRLEATRNLLLDYGAGGASNNDLTISSVFAGMVLLIKSDGDVEMPGLDTAGFNTNICAIAASGKLIETTDTDCVASSGRFKENINNINYGLSDVMKMRSVMFAYKPEIEIGIDNKPGFIAEEMGLIIPEIITYDEEGLPYSIEHIRLLPILTKAIQELKAENDKLRARIEALEL